MNQSARILLVEDDPALGANLVRMLELENWAVDHLTCLSDAFEAIVATSYRAVLLDRRLPDGDGIALVPAIKSRPFPASIIFLTARDEVSDRIEGLDAGADDYLVKPFAFGELLARLRVRCRSAGPGLAAVPPMKVGGLAFDAGTRSASVNGEPVSLPRRELALLEVLVRRAGRVVIREHMDSELYGIDGDVSTNALETQVSRLRKRLTELRAGVEIKTIRGVGYLLQPCLG